MRSMDRRTTEQVLARYEQLLDAWNAQNADGFGAVFTDDVTARWVLTAR